MLFNVARDFGRDLYGEFEARYEDILRGQQSFVLPLPPRGRCSSTTTTATPWCG